MEPILAVTLVGLVPNGFLYPFGVIQNNIRANVRNNIRDTDRHPAVSLEVYRDDFFKLLILFGICGFK